MNASLESHIIDTLLAQAPEGLVVIDVPSNQILRANKIFAGWCGRSETELVGKALNELLHFSSNVNHTKKSASESSFGQGFQGFLRNAHGAEIPVLIRMGNKPTDQTQQIVFIHKDRVPSPSLKQYPEIDPLTRQIFAHVQEGVIFYDHELRYLFWNRFMERITGYSEQEVLGQQPWILFPFLAQQGLQANLMRALQGEHVEIAEIWVDYQRTGFQGWVSANYSPVYDKDQNAIGVVTTIRDHTRQKQSAERIKQSEGLHRALVENASEGINILDPTGKIIYQSPVSSKILGYSSEETQDQNALSFVYSEDLPKMQQQLQEVLQNPDKVFDISARLVRKDQSIIWMEGRAQNQLNNPAISGIIVNWRDVTRRRIAEEQSKIRLNELSLLTEIGQLAISVHSEDELLSQVTLSLAKYLPTDDCGFLLLDDNSQKLIAHPSYVYRIPRELPPIFEVGKGITGRVVETGKPIREGDILKNPYFLEINPNTRSELCAPLWVDGKIIGVFNLENPNPHAYTQAEEFVLTTALNLLGNTVARLRLQNRLKKNQQFLTTIIQTAAEGICVCTGRSGHPLIQFRIWNDQMVQLTGYTLEEINRFGWYQTIYPDPEHQKLAIARMERMHQGEDLHGEIWPIRRKDGEVRMMMMSTSGVEIENGEIATVAILQDITEYNQSKQALVESQRMLRLVLDSIPLGVFWKDRNSRYLGCNRVVAKAFGLPSDEAIIGRDDYSFSCLTRDQADFFIQKDQEVMSKGIPEYGILEQATLADQSTIWMETNKIPIRNEQNEVVGILGTWQDVTKRQEALAALQVSEERYKAFVTQSTEGIWRFQMEEPVPISLPADKQIELFFERAYLAECNDAFAKMYGYEKNTDVYGFRMNQLLVPNDPKNTEYLKAFIDSGYQIAEAESYEYDRYGNVHIFLNSMIGHIRDGYIHYAWGMQRDITERKQAEERIRESERKLNAIASTVPQGLYVFDLTTQQTIYSNREIWRDLGYSPEEAIVFGDNPLAYLLHPEDRARFPELLKRWDSVNDHQVIETEYRMLHKSGEWRWFRGRDAVHKRDASGKVIQIIGTVQDVTERFHAEEKLRRSEANLALAQKIGQIGSWEMNFQTGELYWSEQQFRQCGLEPNGRVPTLDEFIEMIHPEDRERIREKLQNAFKTGQSVDDEYRFVLPNGEIRWLAGRGTVELDELGQPKRFLGISQNITERKKAEAEQRRLELQLQQTQKLESLGILAGGIAHDFNNLLTSILGYADLALEELPEGSSTRDLIEEMINGALQAAELTRQMLAYSGKGRFKVEALNLSDLVEGLSRLLQISITKKCSLRSQLAKNLPLIEGDATQIRQIIMNLVINASEAIGDNNGLISVITGAKFFDKSALAEYPLHEELQEGNYVYLEVSDTGSGMSPETLSKIFDPFFTTKFTGRGLGLSAVLGIVRGHKGAIKCTSELGKGTTFQVIFPVSEVSSPSIPKQTSTFKPWHGSGLVLLVDDEASVRNLAKTMLEKMGFQVQLAQDGKQALELFQSGHHEIRLVLLDLTMPNLDGEQTYRELRQINQKIPVILSSGYSNQLNQERYASLGFAGFIQKPFRYDELSDIVQKALAETPSS
ncbi:MAG: PAS domain S-box protein [Gemmataceae bacterium]|nr:PAS domain S-box protein [Gemmataceae bacterium]